MEQMRLGQGEMIPTGILQEVNQTRLEAAEKASLEGEEYARKSQTHLWLVIVTHKASEQMLNAADSQGDEQPILDADTIWMRPAMGCYICEQPYEPQLRRRRCPGEPR